MMIHSQPCTTFVVDINAYVDGQLAAAEAGRLVDHTKSCEACNDYLDSLRLMSELHRNTKAAMDSGEHDVAALKVDPQSLFGAITGSLLADKQESLARLFYEIGKAYVLLGNRSLPGEQAVSVSCAKPRDIRKSEAVARRTLLQSEELREHGEHAERGLFGRSRKLFNATGKGRANALGKGRSFLDEALALDPTLDEARLYLGLHHMLLGHAGRARTQFEQVHREGRSELLRLMGLQGLGKLHEDRGDYRAAVECYTEVIERVPAEDAPRLLQSFVNLPVSCAKAGMLTESVEHFAALADRFPQKAAQIQSLISKKRAFQAVLHANAELIGDLRRRVPALFDA